MAAEVQTEDQKAFKRKKVPKLEKTISKKKKLPVNPKLKPSKDNGKHRKDGDINEKTSASDEKPNWAELRKQRKELKEKRKAKKLTDTYNIVVEAKQIHEQLRRTKLQAESKVKLTKKLHDLMKNQYLKMIFSHDMSRVVQWQIKYSTQDIVLEILEDIKPQLLEIFTSKYGKHIIAFLLKKKSKYIKKTLVEFCNSNVIKLASNVMSAPLFEKVFVEVASEKEKNLLKQEFYGDLYKSSKDPSVKTLSDVYKDTENLKTATLSAVKINLTKIINKKLLNSTLVHTVVYEYLQECSKEDKAELILSLKEFILHLSQSKYGSSVAAMCMWSSSSKERKAIIKSIKPHLKDIILSEHGHLIILAIFDCVDDTVFLKKVILSEIQLNVLEVAQNEFGRRVLLYLVARRDTHYFHPGFTEFLKKGDSNEISKKSSDIRAKELLEGIIDNLLNSIKDDTREWLSNGPMQTLTLAILKVRQGSKVNEVLQAIANYIVDTDFKLTDGSKVIEDAGLHLILKKLIQLDKQCVATGELTFGEVLLPKITEKVLKDWINCNRGLYLLVFLIENESESVVSELKKILMPFKSDFQSSTNTGARVLLDKLCV